jgi:hypothetical protein
MNYPILDIRAIAIDIAQADLGVDTTNITRALVCNHYHLDPLTLPTIEQQDDFQEVYKAEVQRLTQMGRKATFIAKNEHMALATAEELFYRITTDPSVSAGELRLAYEAFAKYAGYEPLETKESKGGNSGVNIQINIPDLPGGRLNHLKGDLNGTS